MINRITLLEFCNPGNSLIPKIPVKNKALDKNYVEAVYLNNLYDFYQKCLVNRILLK